MAAKYKKDPDALLDYKVDWQRWLANDSIISASAFVVDSPSDLKIATHLVSANNKTHVIWLSAGITGQEYEVVSRIVTSGGRRNDETFIITIEEQ